MSKLIGNIDSDMLAYTRFEWKTGSNFPLMLVNKFDLVVFDHARGQTSGKWLWYGWNAFRKYFLRVI